MRAALGIVLSMELIGMAPRLRMPSFAASPPTESSRRPTILGCPRRDGRRHQSWRPRRGLVDLSIWRMVPGLGISGMLAAINAVAAGDLC